MASVRTGPSRALVLRGEAGVGKSALLDYLVRHASGCTVARAAGVESEMELAYAGLQQLCAPFLDRLGAPSRPATRCAWHRVRFARRRRAGSVPRRPGGSESAVGCRGGATARLHRGRRAVARRGLGAGAGLRRAPSRGGVGRAGLRRARAERRAASRGAAGARRGRAGRPRLRIELLATVVTGPLDERVRDRIVAETRGNPLALLELPRLAGRLAELAGGFGLSDGPALSGRIEQSFTERLAPLPAPTRLLLLVAAAEPVGDPVLVWRAAAELGIGPDAAAPVDRRRTGRFRGTGALRSSARPLGGQGCGSAGGAPARPPRARRRHRCRCRSGSPRLAPCARDSRARRGRRRRAASARRDERGHAVASRRGRRFTSAPSSSRPIRAAGHSVRSSPPEASTRPARTTRRCGCWRSRRRGRSDELDQARAQLLHAQVDVRDDARSRCSAAAARGGQAARAAGSDARARDLPRSVRGWRFPRTAWCTEAMRARSRRPFWPPSWEPSTRACDLLLDGLALLTREGYVAAAPTLKVALRAFRDEPICRRRNELRWLWLASRIARALADDAAWDELTARHLELARRTGAFSRLSVALTDRVVVELSSGRFGVADIAGRRVGRRRRGHRQSPRPAHVDHAGQLARTGRRGAGADRGARAGGAATWRGALGRCQRVGQRAALQRARPLRGRAGRSRAGRRGPARAGAVDLGAGGADRGCRAQRPGWSARRSRSP